VKAALPSTGALEPFLFRGLKWGILNTVIDISIYSFLSWLSVRDSVAKYRKTRFLFTFMIVIRPTRCK
jgi:hypothetical protein